MSDSQMQTVCERLLDDLDLLPPLDPESLCQRLSEFRGYRIKLRAVDLGAVTSIGHLVPQRNAVRILYDKNAPEPQKTSVIYHEVIHLIRGHLDPGQSLTCGISTTDDLDRSYTDWKEHEAEIGSRILSRMSRERAQPNRLSERSGSAEQNIAAAFGFIGRDRT